jgi:hypothetical protein
MIIETLEISDWEPLMFRLIPTGGTTLAPGTVGQFVRDWFRKRTTQPVCQSGCRQKEINVQELRGGAILVGVQWVCPECLNVLIAALGAQYPNLERVLVGFSDSEPGPPDETPKGVLAFPGRMVTFENGRTERVGDFKIIHGPVTVAEMQKFCNATGYVTSAERLEPDDEDVIDTYRANASLSVLKPSIHGMQPAEFLSYRDAIAYCSWSGHRLLTESEYFVAALVDDRARSREPTRKSVLEAFASGKVAALGGIQAVITDTRVGELIVARSGPLVVKAPDWVEDDGRELVGEDDPVGSIVRVLR